MNFAFALSFMLNTPDFNFWLKEASLFFAGESGLDLVNDKNINHANH